MKKYDEAVVIGKFHPFHIGHSYLVHHAISLAYRVTVLVVDGEVAGRTIPATRRAQWISEIFAYEPVKVRVMPDIEYDVNSEFWAEYTIAFLGFVPDVVITSEAYGETWAGEMGCDHILLDPDRESIPFSATQFFEDPQGGLEYLQPEVRADYIPRVVVLGAESTGTTTLARDLKRAYRTECVPEFGRLRDERRRVKGLPINEWDPKEFIYTALVQEAMENEYARRARDVLICDTNTLATYEWLHRYHRDPPLDVQKKLWTIARRQHPALYIVTSPEGVEPEEDGLRFEMERREEMHQEFIADLTHLDEPYIVVEGSPHERELQARKAIDEILGR